MTRILRNIFICSLLLYLISTMYVRFRECTWVDFSCRVFYSLPLDAFPLKYIWSDNSLLTQIGVLSFSEVAQLLKTNPDHFPNCYEGTTLRLTNQTGSKKDYVVLRLKNTDREFFQKIKYYFSCFPYPIVQSFVLPSHMSNYHNFIMPYPACLKKDKQKNSIVSIQKKDF